MTSITFDTEPSAYRHWELSIDPPVATLTMKVTPEAGLRDDYRRITRRARRVVERVFYGREPDAT